MAAPALTEFANALPAGLERNVQSGTSAMVSHATVVLARKVFVLAERVTTDQTVRLSQDAAALSTLLKNLV